MIVYKWKHKPTGLFYQPVRSSGGTKTNLSKDGKLYHKKYNLTKSNSDMHIAINGNQLKIFEELNLDIIKYNYTYQRYSQTSVDDWELIEYELVESMIVDETDKSFDMDNYVNTYNCPNCSSTIYRDNYCSECGTKLIWND